MISEAIGLDGSQVTVGGAAVAAVLWVWRKISGVEEKLSAIELKVAEQYVTRPEFKELADKIDVKFESMGTKIDSVNSNLLTLTNMLIKKD